MADQKPEKTTGLSTRGAVAVSAAVALILLAAVFIGTRVVPFLRTRRMVEHFSRYADAVEGLRAIPPTREQERDMLSHYLGSPERVRLQLEQYVRLPDWLAPHRKYVAGFLGYCGRPAVGALIEALADADPGVRRYAAVGLAVVGQDGEDAIADEILPALIAALKDRAESGAPRRGPVSDWASEALGAIGAPAVPSLAGALEDPDLLVRDNAIRALSRMGACAKAAVPAVGRALRDPDPVVRREAVRLLGELGPAAGEAVPGLVHALSDPLEWIRYDATVALGKIGPAAGGAASALAKTVGDPEALAKTRPPGDKRLKERNQAVRPGEPIDFFVSPLHEPGSGIRNPVALEALGKIGPASKAAVPALEGLLQDEKLTNSDRAEIRGTLKKIRSEVEAEAPPAPTPAAGEAP